MSKISKITKNNKKILITIIFILLAGMIGTVSAELILETSKGSTPLPEIGNEIILHADLENKGSREVTNIVVVMRTGDEEICSRTIPKMNAGNKTRISCPWKITKSTECGYDTVISVNVNGGGQSLSSPIRMEIMGRHYNMELDPELPQVDEELKITIKDEDGKVVDGAKILLFEVFRIPGGYVREDPVDIGDVYTKNGQAQIVINEPGRYKILAESERDSYCKSVYREREVLDSFIIQGLKSAYGLDDDFNIKVMDRHNNPVEVDIQFSGPVDRWFYTTDIPFNFRQKGFEKGSYHIWIKEKCDYVGGEVSIYHTISEKITIAAGKTTSTSTSSTSSTSTSSSSKTTTTKQSLKIELIPDKDKINAGDEITIYVKSGGKAIDDAIVKITVGISGVKEFKTKNGEVKYTIERADFYSIHAEKEGYYSADVSFDLTEEKDKIIPVESTQEKENTEQKSEKETESVETVEKTSGTNEMSNYDKQISINEPTIKRTEISNFEKTSYLEGMNYKNILITLGIIIVLLVITILSIFIWKLVR